MNNAARRSRQVIISSFPKQHGKLSRGVVVVVGGGGAACGDFPHPRAFWSHWKLNVLIEAQTVFDIISKRTSYNNYVVPPSPALNVLAHTNPAVPLVFESTYPPAGYETMMAPGLAKDANLTL